MFPTNISGSFWIGLALLALGVVLAYGLKYDRRAVIGDTIIRSLIFIGIATLAAFAASRL